MLVGMGVVFSFLVLLVILMKVSGSLLSKFPEPEQPAKPSGQQAPAQAHAHRQRWPWLSQLLTAPKKGANQARPSIHSLKINYFPIY